MFRPCLDHVLTMFGAVLGHAWIMFGQCVDHAATMVEAGSKHGQHIFRTCSNTVRTPSTHGPERPNVDSVW